MHACLRDMRLNRRSMIDEPQTQRYCEKPKNSASLTNY